MAHRLLMLILFIALAMTLAACGGSEPPAATATATPAGVPTEVAVTTEPATPTAAPATVEPAPPTAAPSATPLPTPLALCAELPRPALIVNDGATFAAVDPVSGARCPLAMPLTAAYPQASGETIYYVQSDQAAGSAVVARLDAAGRPIELEPTSLTGDVAYLLRFAVSVDDSRLAWSQMRVPDAANAMALRGDLWIGAADGSGAVAVFQDSDGGQNRIVSPIRFSGDGQTLFFTWEPIGLGGMWASFNGRYDNLYRVAATGGQPQKVFDCADAGLFLCLGDFRDDGTLATIDTARVIHVIGPDGAELAAIATTGDYAGYPTFSPSGDLYYSEAMIDETAADFPLPAPGTIYRVAAPYSGGPAVVASAEGLLVSAVREAFLDAGHLVVNTATDGQWGMGVMDAAGTVTRLEPWPSTYPAAIWPAP